MATREVLAAMAALYAHDSQRAVSCEAAGGVDVARRVQSGEVVDVVVLAANAIDALIREGKLAASSRVDLVKSGIAIAVRAHRPMPDIGSEEAVKRAVAAAATLSYSTGPSGVYLEALFERWGMLPAMRSRIVVPPPGVPVGSLVASGAAELGFQQLSELKNLADIQVVGPLPPAIQSVTVFAAGLSVACRDVDAARALIGFMASPAVAELKRQHGMEGA